MHAQQFQWYSKDATYENPVTEKVDLSVVDTVPHTMYMAEHDQYCVPWSVSKKHYLELGKEPKLKFLDGFDHMFPIMAAPDNLVQDYIDELQIPEEFL